MISKRLTFPSALAIVTSVAPPLTSNSTVLAPTPRVSLIPETEPAGLISAVEAAVSTDLT